MVKLNLLPAKVRAAELLRLAALAGMAVYLVLFGILAWRYAVAKQAQAAVEVKIAKVQAELKPLQAIAEEVKKLSNEKKEQDANKSKLNQLAQRQAYWVRVMDLIPDLMQGGQVWLVAVDQMPDRNLRRISLEGRALSLEAWADFYNNLESQALVDGLKIETPPAIYVELPRKSYTFKVSFILKDAQ